MIDSGALVEPASVLAKLSPELNLLLARMREVPLGEAAVAMSFDPSRGAQK